jgi:hypothetical protein|tara:strand:- start:1260 stop:1469 length:210 start_codon:yes stop_codon:yes gene_type:complete
MIDKLINMTAKAPQDTAAYAQEQIDQPTKVSLGMDGFQKEKTLNMKKGGFIAKGCGKVMSNRRKKTRMY